MTSTSLSSPTAFTTLLVLITIGLSTILPLPFILIHGLVMVRLDPPIFVTYPALIDQSWKVSDLR
ncbi:hypothetical protein A2U01_0090022, partial [Trifolium medium]|nr:hypothetical protein [Trifolium medium]